MTDRPVIFSAPMILALLGGRKTQTRRLAWRAPARSCPGVECEHGFDACPRCDAPRASPWQRVKPGDRLWTRENWYAARGADSVKPREMTPDWGVAYAATYSYAETGLHGKTRPAIHMPRWASRITLTVTEVRRQRLWEISDHDARAEGTHGYRQLEGYPAFRAIWSDLHGAENWDANPGIVALTFTVERRNIDAKNAA